MAKRINLDTLHDELKQRLDEYAALVFPNAKKQASKGYRVGDASGAKGDSMWIGESGFHDHATGEKGSLIKLASMAWNESIPQAARMLAEKLAINAMEENQMTEVRTRRELVPLNEKDSEYMQKRGLDVTIAKNAGVCSTNDNNIAFQLLDTSGKSVGVKFKGEKGWHSEPGSNHALWPLKYVQDEFPNEDTIYITEGHWDALAGLQAGFPTVSIPNGAVSKEWVHCCYDFINSYSTIILCFDADEAGTTGLKMATGTLSKGVRIVDYPEGCKDLNDVLVKHGVETVRACMLDSHNFEPESVVNAVRLYEEARETELFEFEHESIFGFDFPFKYRPNEYTVYTAYTGHGKSNIIRQTLLNFSINDDAKSFLASFEDTPRGITRELLTHLGPHVPEHEVKRILRNIDLYDTRQLTSKKKRSKVKIEELLELFEIQFKKYGVKHFVIDNLMTLAIDRSDLSAQSGAADAIRQFVISFPVHLHLVAHPRKQPSNLKSLEPPDAHEIRGAAEIADLSWNVMGHIRNIKKEREIAAMRLRKESEEAIKMYQVNHPDAMMHIHKQRTTGELPTCWLWFDKATKTYRPTP